MQKNKIAFSLVEIIIATGIITIGVFGIYKTIGENIKIINNSGNYLQSNYLFPLAKECLNNVTFASLVLGNTYEISLGSNMDKCLNYAESPDVIDSIDYSLSAKILDLGSNFIKWEIIVESDNTGTLTGTYIQKK